MAVKKVGKNIVFVIEVRYSVNDTIDIENVLETARGTGEADIVDVKVEAD